jgi:hypothetical protein
MRGYNTAAPGAVGYIDWVVNDQPDGTAAFVPPPFVPSNVINITVNKVVQSKTENWLQPDQGYITADGKFFHLNAFDQLHASVPSPTVIPVPTGLVGIAVTRGGTTDSNGLLLAGASTNFFSTLCWDEAAARWKFIRNTNGDHVTQGAYQAVNMGDLIISGFINVDGYLAVGINPALSGIIRIPNNQFIVSRNSTNTGDGYVVGLDNVNRVRLGSVIGDQVFIPGYLRVGSNAPASTDGYIRDGSNTPADGTGNPFIRVGNNTTIISARDSAGTANLALVTLNSTNNLILGNAGATSGSVIYNTSTSLFHQFQTNTTTFLELGTAGTPATNNPNNFVRFTSAIVAPSIYQVTAAAGSGQIFNLQAQSTTAASQTGGSISLTAGSAPASGFGGTVDLLAGGAGSFPVTATLKMRIHPTLAPTAANNNSIQIFENIIRIDSAQTSPIYRQDATVGATGQVYTIQAQDASTTGGDLRLTSGAGSIAANGGFINLQTGGITRVQISPTQTTIFGNLLVGGTTTSIASTVVELADRVLNLNSSANSFPADAPIPVNMAGIAIDRGTTGGAKRNYHGLFWDEPDGYWKFAVSTDGYTSQSDTALTTTLPVMAQYIIVQPTATKPVTVNLIPTTGGYRSLNNTVHSASRAVGATQDLILVSTDATDHLIWGAATINAGHIFRTTAGTIYDFRAADVSTYTLTPQSAGTTTLQATSGVTALVYSHQTTGAATGAPTVHQAQSAATNGGNLILSSGRGSGVSTDGYVGIETGNVDRIKVFFDRSEFRDANEALRITPVSAGTTQITYASTVTAAQINQTTTGAATGAPMSVQSQNAATTGGSLTFVTGTGATNPGNMIFQIGGTTLLTLFNTTATPNTLQWLSTTTSPVFNQQTTGGASGQTLTIQSQNAATTGGNLTLTSGTATTAGDINLQTGAVSRVIVHPTFTEFRDTAEALRITPVSAGTTAVTFASTVTAVTVSQTTTGGATGALTTIQAQNAATTGGGLNLTSGTGGTTNGTVNLQVGGVTTASLVTNKFVFNAGRRRHTTNVTTTYPVVATDDYIAITTLAAPFTITLPATPTVGDEYVIKDATGNAAVSNVTVSGNGNNIDGAASFLLSQPYAAATFTFVNGQWSVS